MNHAMRRRKPKVMSKAGFIFILLSVRALPATGPGGIRRKAWRDLTAGAYRERENLSLRCQGSGRASGCPSGLFHPPPAYTNIFF